MRIIVATSAMSGERVRMRESAGGGCIVTFLTSLIFIVLLAATLGGCLSLFSH